MGSSIEHFYYLKICQTKGQVTFAQREGCHISTITEEKVFEKPVRKG